MPTPGNPKRTTRMDDESWAAFEAACERIGVHPATMLRTLAEWFYRKPGVTVRRPPAGHEPDSAPGAMGDKG